MPKPVNWLAALQNVRSVTCYSNTAPLHAARAESLRLMSPCSCQDNRSVLRTGAEEPRLRFSKFLVTGCFMCLMTPSREGACPGGAPLLPIGSKGAPSPSRAADHGMRGGRARRLRPRTRLCPIGSCAGAGRGCLHAFVRRAPGTPSGGPPAHKGVLSRRLGRPWDRLPAKRPAVCAAAGPPLIRLLPAGQVRACRGAEARAPGPGSPPRVLPAPASAAFWPGAATAGTRSTPTPPSPSGAPASRTCAAAPRKGAASPGETTAAPTPASAPSASLLPESAGYES